MLPALKLLVPQVTNFAMRLYPNHASGQILVNSESHDDSLILVNYLHGHGESRNNTRIIGLCQTDQAMGSSVRINFDKLHSQSMDFSDRQPDVYLYHP